ncbi:hypothetical protein PIB30_032530 [Stylosanthes scabra]|uniref:Uncharacterized protein n=1 Tax=Stylosanthes scabra TaxID=79078 RepID=A0ABU6YE59_9FABA|nr:hypothetical protein [Stylosanthes scabra]
MKRNQEGRIVASGVASRLHKHQQKLPPQQESSPHSLKVAQEFRTGRESGREASVKWRRCREIENIVVIFFVVLSIAGHFLSETGNVTFKDVHQGLSKQRMEGTYSYDQGYTPWNPPPYQHHAPQYNVYQSNGFGDAYYGYEDPLHHIHGHKATLKAFFKSCSKRGKRFRKLESKLRPN